MGNFEIDHCSKCDCGNKKPIVNKRYYLCQDKNRERLDSQKSNSDRKLRKIKKVSQRQKERLIELKSVYEELSVEREHVCSGCGTNECLTHSHIIPRSKRKDLEIDKENILYDCMDCHTKWEHGTLEQKKQLLNFNYRLTYIKKVDINYYNLLTLKWEN